VLVLRGGLAAVVLRGGSAAVVWYLYAG